MRRTGGEAPCRARHGFTYNAGWRPEAEERRTKNYGQGNLRRQLCSFQQTMAGIAGEEGNAMYGSRDFEAGLKMGRKEVYVCGGWVPARREKEDKLDERPGRAVWKQAAREAGRLETQAEKVARPPHLHWRRGGRGGAVSFKGVGQPSAGIFSMFDPWRFTRARARACPPALVSMPLVAAGLELC
jgi:hypothetical protein